ncbi:MAG: hypothetical protein NXH73_09035 [Flavobacteriaceae bacterium]|nr:hypothetical protein [Flavobacteriaceae bacterium]
MNWELSSFEKRFFRGIFLLVFIPTVAYVAYNKIFKSEIDWSKFYENERMIHFDGVISNKYVNYKKRALNTIVIDNDLHYEILGIWKSKFDIGDYVFKEKGSLIIKLIKKDTQDTLYFDYRDIEIKE